MAARALLSYHRQEGASMACPHFVEERFSHCAAVRGLLIPSIYERERFCRSSEACKQCPTFRAFESRGGKIAQEIYYQLWLPEAVERVEEPSARSATEPTPPSV
jgi:hypothetical protein